MKQSLIAPAVLVLIGYLLVVGLLPRWIAPGADDLSVAAMRGYNVNVAYWGALAWTGVTFAALWSFGRTASSWPSVTVVAPSPASRFRWPETAAVFVLAVLAHWPPFLVRYGPYAEEGYLLSTLARMQSGQAPFIDFEFLYGPLMIVPAHAWMRWFGFSMEAYYWLYALLQGAFYATLALTLQRCLPRFTDRLLAFVILVLFTADGLLGLNWFGWRKFMSVIAMLVVAARPLDLRNAALAGAILAVHLAYSLEYGAAGLAACGAMYAVLLGRPGASKVVGCGLTALGVALAGSLALAAVATGDLGAYVASALAVLRQAAAHNTGAFEFYWTVHSVAVFALLSLAVVALALGMRRLSREAPSADDLFLAGAVVFALVGLRAGFQRADIYHMSAPFFPLAMATLAHPRLRVFLRDARSAKVAMGLVAVAAICNLIGVLPIGQAQVMGLTSGARDVIRGVPRAGPVEARGYSIQSERTSGNEDIVALAAFLSQDSMKHRPVLLYNRLWLLNVHLGVTPIGYLNYEWMYGDAAHPIENVLAEHPDALVVMDARSHESLITGRYPQAKPPNLSGMRRLGLVTSTVHYEQSPEEREIKDRLWRERVGRLIEDTHREIARFGPFVVLGAPPAQTSPARQP